MESLEIFPELMEDTHFTQEKVKVFREIRHIHHWFRLLYLKKKVRERFLYLMALFSGMEPRLKKSCIERFELTKKFQQLSDQVEEFIQEQYKTVHAKKFLKKSQIYDLFRRLDVEALLYLMAAYSHNERFQQYASLFIIEISRKKQLINGNDIQKVGLKRGEDLRKIIDTIHKMHIDGEIKTREEALACLKKWVPS
jgi:hypothetical protein